MVSTVRNASFIVKLTGSYEPGPYKPAFLSEPLAILGQDKSASYSELITAHPILIYESAWVMLNIQDRRSQFVGLCLRAGKPCEATFNPGTREVQVVGDLFDEPGLNGYENTMILQKPEGTSIHATIILINGRVIPSTTVGTIGIYTQNPLCSKCDSNNGGCETEIKCICKNGYFGRTCSRKVTRVSSESTNEIRNLAQYETLHLEDFYDEGEKETQFTLKNNQYPNTLFLINENDDQDYNLTFSDNRGESSAATYIERWGGTSKKVSVTVNKKWMICTVMNLSPMTSNYELNMFRIRSNTFNTVSLVLYILMVVAIALLIVLSICVICIKMRSNARVRQAALALKEAELQKITEKEIEKYLPVVQKKDDPNQFKDACTICLETNDNSKVVRKVFFCGHLFHSDCLMDWIKQKESCPNCKRDFSKKAILEYEKPPEKPGAIVDPKVKPRGPETEQLNQGGRNPSRQNSIVQGENRPAFVRSVLNQQAVSSPNRFINLNPEADGQNTLSVRNNMESTSSLNRPLQTGSPRVRLPSRNGRNQKPADSQPATLDVELSENRPVLNTQTRRRTSAQPNNRQPSTVSIRVEDRGNRGPSDDFQTVNL